MNYFLDFHPKANRKDANGKIDDSSRLNKLKDIVPEFEHRLN